MHFESCAGLGITNTLFFLFQAWNVNWETKHMMIQFDDDKNVIFNCLSADCKVKFLLNSYHFHPKLKFWILTHLHILFILFCFDQVVHEFIGGYIFLSMRSKETNQNLNEEMFHKLTGGWV